MSGTSQATPCVSGIAAVLLSTGKVTGSGATKVENLKKLMASGCMKSGVGKGTPNLAKCLGLSTAKAAPKAPTVSLKPGTYKSASANIKFNTIPGAEIYYSLNGKDVTYKNGVVSSNAWKYGNYGVVISGSKVVVKAIAVSDTNKLVSKQATFTYIFKPAVSSITLASKNGVNKVAKGSSIGIKATVSPAHAANKKIKWSVTTTPANATGVKIDKSGNLKVDKKSTATGCTVIAEATDGSGKRGTLGISIVAASDNLIKSISIPKGNLTKSMNYGANWNYYPVLKRRNGSDPGKANYKSLLSVTSSDTSIATVTSTYSGGNYYINTRALSPGKTTIRLTATDGSGVSFSFELTVKPMVTSVTVTGPSGNRLAAGKGFKPKATVFPEKATNKTLTWSLTAWPGGYTKDNCGVKVNKKTGAVSSSANAALGNYTIKAETAIGKTVSATYSFTLIAAARKVKSITLGKSKANIFRVNNQFGSPTSLTVSITALNVAKGTVTDKNQLKVVSSNPGIATVTYSANSFTVKATGNATGSTNITVSSTDGSGIKKTCKVTVSNPPSAIRLAIPAGRSDSVARTKKLKLKAVIETAYGPVSKASKKVKFVSNNPDLMSVSKSGVVKSKSASGKPIISVSTMDGSNLKADLQLYCCTKLTKLVPVQKRGWMYRGDYGTLVALPLITSEKNDGAKYCEYDIKVNKKGLSVKPNDDYYYGVDIFGLKKGTYKVTIKPNDGNTCKCTFTVIVK